MELRQSTSRVIRFGPFLNDVDGKTPEISLTITQSDMQISKGGAAFSQKNSAGNASHDVDGFYFTTLDSTDNNTTSSLQFEVTVAGALPVWENYDVVTQSYFDAKYVDTFNNLGGVAQTADNDTILQTLPIATDLVSNGAINTLGGAVVNVDLVDTTTTNSDMRGTDSANTVVPPSVSEFNARTITSSSYATAANLTVVDTVVDAIKVKTDQMVFTVTNQLDSNMLTHTALIPANYITSTGIAANALNGKGDWNIGKTGYSLTQTFPVNFNSMVVSVTGDVSSDVNKINNTIVVGTGISSDKWRA